jgi:multicomponent Na+:H+ antiporter subunit G
MTEWLTDLLAMPFLFAGGFFYLVGALGIMRMPDVFTRLHAASVSDTLGAGLLIIGMMIHAGPTLVTAKLAVILVILAYTGPVATHAIARAARYAGIEPMHSKIGEGASSKR